MSTDRVTDAARPIGCLRRRLEANLISGFLPFLLSHSMQTELLLLLKIKNHVHGKNFGWHQLELIGMNTLGLRHEKISFAVFARFFDAREDRRV